MNNRGFSIVQVLVSIGLMGIIIVAGFKIFEAQTKLGKSSSFMFESMVLLDEMKGLLSNSNSCKESLQGKSSYYDEVEDLLQLVPGSDVPFAEYEIQSLNSARRYGQGEVVIESMRILGEKAGFKSENGYFLFEATFKQRKGNQKFVGQFPVRYIGSEFNKIVECQSSPGITASSDAIGDSGVWEGKKENEGDDVVTTAYYEKGKVIVGSIKARASLNIENGFVVARPQITEACDQEREGEISYDQSKDNLFFCSKGRWLNISGAKGISNNPQRFNIKGVGTDVVTKTVDGKFSFCKLITMQGKAGRCFAQMNLQEKGKWEILLNSTVGNQLYCEFECR